MTGQGTSDMGLEALYRQTIRIRVFEERGDDWIRRGERAGSKPHLSIRKDAAAAVAATVVDVGAGRRMVTPSASITGGTGSPLRAARNPDPMMADMAAHDDLHQKFRARHRAAQDAPAR